MRLLLTTDAVGGIWTYALELARALRPHAVEVTLAVLGPAPSPRQRAAAREIPGLELRECGGKLEWMDAPWEDVRRCGEWLLELEAELRPDVVHLNGYSHGALPWRAPVLVSGHSCVLSWWEAVRGEPAPPDREAYRRAVTRGLRAADLAAAPTRAMLEALRRHYGPLPAARVLPNGRDPALFPPGAREPLILSAGRLWDAAKNLAALERVAPELPWPVYVAGDDRHPEGGTAVCRHVRPLGGLEPDALAGWLGRAAIYALPARYEPFGLSALEAGLAGCALVLGDVPSLREVWDEAAVFVPPDDPAALAAALRGLIAAPERRAGMAERARTRAFEFTPERMAGAHLAAYRWLLDPSRASGESRAGEEGPEREGPGREEEEDRAACAS